MSSIKKAAAFDIGTNSILGCIAEKQNNHIRVIKELNTIVKLGKDLSNDNILKKEKIEDAVKVICEFKKVVESYGIESVMAAGTMVLRKAKNRKHLIEMVKERCSVYIKLVSTYEEALLSYLGVISGLKGRTNKITVIDIGGGSTEIISGKDKEIIGVHSFELGIIDLTEKFFYEEEVKEKNIREAFGYVDKKLCKVKVEDRDLFIGIGGTITNFAAIKHKMKEYDPELINITYLSREEIEYIFNILKEKNLKERRKVEGLGYKRADTIIAGGVILIKIMNYLNIQRFLVSDRGLRHGLLYKFFMR